MKDGPEKCSGLKVKQYNEAQLQRALGNGFTTIRCLTEDHRTPSDTIQNILFCRFQVNSSFK
jgi:hypothetical protein